MSGIVLAALIWLGLCCPLTAEEVDPNVVTFTCPGTSVMDKLTEMDDVQKSIQQTLLSLYSSVGVGPDLDTKLQALETKLETRLTATETRLENTETELKETKTKLETAETERKETKTELQEAKTELGTTKTELNAIKNKLEATETALQMAMMPFKRKGGSTGSTFVRWGRKSCTNRSQLVYSGVVGGSHYFHIGGAANSLCLTLHPQVDNTSLPLGGRHALLYGTEYEMPNHNNHDVPCSVCLAAHSTTIMIPGTLNCPLGWTTQYTGHLVAGYHKQKSSSQYVCLDDHPEYALITEGDHLGNEFFYTVTQCGSLPCPPYTNNEVVLCVVCSK